MPKLDQSRFLTGFRRLSTILNIGRVSVGEHDEERAHLKGLILFITAFVGTLRAVLMGKMDALLLFSEE
jgi:hypothetical protein